MSKTNWTCISFHIFLSLQPRNLLSPLLLVHLNHTVAFFAPLQVSSSLSLCSICPSSRLQQLTPCPVQCLPLPAPLLPLCPFSNSVFIMLISPPQHRLQRLPQLLQGHHSLNQSLLITRISLYHIPLECLFHLPELRGADQCTNLIYENINNEDFYFYNVHGCTLQQTFTIMKLSEVPTVSWWSRYPS